MDNRIRLDINQFAFLMLLENAIAEMALRANQTKAFCKGNEAKVFLEAAELLKDRHERLLNAYQNRVQIASPSDVPLVTQ